MSKGDKYGIFGNLCSANLQAVQTKRYLNKQVVRYEQCQFSIDNIVNGRTQNPGVKNLHKITIALKQKELSTQQKTNGKKKLKCVFPADVVR